MNHNNCEAITPIIAVILLVGTTVLLAGIVGVMVSGTAGGIQMPDFSHYLNPYGTVSTTSTGAAMDYAAPWTTLSADPAWSPRYMSNSVVLPDGTILLIGGVSGGTGADGMGHGNNDVWKSTDNGRTWTLVTGAAGFSARWNAGTFLMPDNSIVLVGGTDASGGTNDVWRSTDNGATWTQVTAHAGWTARSYPGFVSTPDGALIVMGGDLVGDGSANDVWKSTDNGATWTQVAAHADWTIRDIPNVVALADNSVVMIGGASGGPNNEVWRSTDYGATWTQMSANAGWSEKYFPSAVPMPDGSIVLMGGYHGTDRTWSNDMWRSTDNGATWTQVNAHADWPARDMASSVALPDGSVVLMGGQTSGGGYIHDVWQLTPPA